MDAWVSSDGVSEKWVRKQNRKNVEKFIKQIYKMRGTQTNVEIKGRH